MVLVQPPAAFQLPKSTPLAVVRLTLLPETMRM